MFVWKDPATDKMNGTKVQWIIYFSMQIKDSEIKAVTKMSNIF